MRIRMCILKKEGAMYLGRRRKKKIYEIKLRVRKIVSEKRERERRRKSRILPSLERSIQLSVQERRQMGGSKSLPQKSGH